MSDVIDDIIDAFEQVWTDRGGGHHGKPHDGERRSCIVPFIDQHERLCALLDDPRINGLLVDLLGARLQLRRFGRKLLRRRYRLAFRRLGQDRPICQDRLLPRSTDPSNTGCLRVIPGSHILDDRFARTVQDQIRESGRNWGVQGEDLLPGRRARNPTGRCRCLQPQPQTRRLRRKPPEGACSPSTVHNAFPRIESKISRSYISGHARFWIDRLYGETMVATAGPERRTHLEQGHGARRPPGRTGCQVPEGDARAVAGMNSAGGDCVEGSRGYAVLPE